MDNLAHSLVGAALGRVVGDRHVPHAAWIGAIAANAPDWTEFFIGLPGTHADYLVLHRGITHSLLGAAIEIVALTALLGAAWWRSGGKPPWRWLAACVGVAVLSHLFMDWLGSYGWRPFLPWSNTWYYLDWVAIVDPFFWLVPLIALAWGTNRHWLPLSGWLVIGGGVAWIIVRGHDIVAPWVLIACALTAALGVVGWVSYWFGPVRRRGLAGVALLILGVYAGAQGLVSRVRTAAIAAAAERRFGPAATSAALTEIGHPFTWEAIYASPDTVAGDDWRLPRHTSVPAVARALRDTPDGRAMAQFARFLAADIDSTAKTIYIRDARYARAAREGWGVVRVRLGGE
ncbi:MAG TPA: metal-dependent hydrolase [Gemmatimonadales bacterium]|nr:metal-dependent hydrolase [Gemmatimonadales bacterium]